MGISDLTQLPAHPDESLPVVEQEKEKKPKGINLPISEMSYDWMNDDDAMGSFDSDDEEDIVEDKSKEPDVVKPKGISLPITEMTMDWMDPIPDIVDPEDPLKNAEKSKKLEEAT